MSAESIIDKQNNKGDTALMVAIRLGHVDTARALLELGADVNVKNAANETALGLAIHVKDGILIVPLLHRGADTKSLGSVDWAIVQHIVGHLASQSTETQK